MNALLAAGLLLGAMPQPNPQAFSDFEYNGVTIACFVVVGAPANENYDFLVIQSAPKSQADRSSSEPSQTMRLAKASRSAALHIKLPSGTCKQLQMSVE